MPGQDVAQADRRASEMMMRNYMQASPQNTPQQKQQKTEETPSESDAPPSDTLQTFHRGFRRGLAVFIESIKFFRTSKEVVTLVLQLLWVIIVVAFGTFMLTKTIMAPVHLILRLFGLFFSTERYRDQLTSWEAQMVGRVALAGPLVVVSFLRYVFYQPVEDTLFQVLRQIDPDLEQHILSKPFKPIWHGFQQTLKRFGRYLMYLPMVLVLARIPLGGLVLSFYFQYQTLHRWSPRPFAVLVAGLATLPETREYATLFAQIFLAEVLMFRELLVPFSQRDILAHYKDEQRIIKKHIGLIVGFIFPYSLCLHIPIIGPLFWIIAQAAIAFMLYELKDQIMEKSK
mmetsp:Transcript_7202/g.10798  ORF Transcript_7202/g.10798 Transcript_7202/m.10798 type:complete len:343 (-) Transcript_7202:21-1049(-)